MFMEVKRVIQKHNDNFNKDTENIKKYVTEIVEQKNTIPKLKKFSRGVSQQLDKGEKTALSYIYSDLFISFLLLTFGFLNFFE